MPRVIIVPCIHCKRSVIWRRKVRLNAMPAWQRPAIALPAAALAGPAAYGAVVAKSYPFDTTRGDVDPPSN